MLALTFLISAFFAYFAIRPTANTILSLRKQINDFSQVDKQLQEKVDTLTRLSFTYRNLESDLEVIQAAIPTRTNLSQVITEVNDVTEGTGVSVQTVDVSNTPITAVTPTDKVVRFAPQLETINFSVTYQGTYDGLLTVLDEISRQDRLISVDTFSISAATNRNNEVESLLLTIKGTAYSLSKR